MARRSNADKENANKETAEEVIEKKETGKKKGFVNPILAQPVDEKEYGKPNVAGVTDDIIPEHHVGQAVLDLEGLKDNPQSVTSEDNGEAKEETTASKRETRKPKSYAEVDEIPEVDEEDDGLPSNKSFTELPKAEQKRGAEQFADMALGLYQWVHEMAKDGLTLDKETLERKALKNKFDTRALQVRLPKSQPDENGHVETMTLQEFLDDYNNNIDDALTIDDEWIAEVKPVLVRILTKNGWALTDEQFILYKIGEDLVKKTATLFTVVRYKNDMLKIAMEYLHNAPDFSKTMQKKDSKIIEQQRELERLRKQMQADTNPSSEPEAKIVSEPQQAPQQEQTVKENIENVENVENVEYVEPEEVSENKETDVDFED